MGGKGRGGGGWGCVARSVGCTREKAKRQRLRPVSHLPSPFEHERSRLLRREGARCSRRPLAVAKEPVEDRVDVVAHLPEGTVAVSRGKTHFYQLGVKLVPLFRGQVLPLLHPPARGVGGRRSGSQQAFGNRRPRVRRRRRDRSPGLPSRPLSRRGRRPSRSRPTFTTTRVSPPARSGVGVVIASSSGIVAPTGSGRSTAIRLTSGVTASHRRGPGGASVIVPPARSGGLGVGIAPPGRFHQRRRRRRPRCSRSCRRGVVVIRRITPPRRRSFHLNTAAAAGSVTVLVPVLPLVRLLLFPPP